jgi:phenylalanine-4-hydroxylase
MEAYGKGGQRALQLGQLHNLARLYWYTIEFGLLRTEQGLRIFGAGILSSPRESVFSLEDASPNRIAFDVERIMRTKHIIDDFQQTYFVIDSFEQLLESSNRNPKSKRMKYCPVTTCYTVAHTPTSKNRGSHERHSPQRSS